MLDGEVVRDEGRGEGEIWDEGSSERVGEREAGKEGESER